MAASAGLAITLVPVLMGYFVRGKIMPEHKNPINRMLMAGYQPFIRLVLSWPKITIVACILIVLATVYPLKNIGSEFMPQLDEGDWMYMPSTRPGVSIGKAREILQQTDKLIMTVPEVKTVFGKIGRAQTATDPAPLTMIESIIQFKPKSEWREGMTPEKLKRELNKAVDLPGITNAWVMPIQTRIDMLATGIKTPIGIKVSGASLAEIQKIGVELEAVLKNVPNTTSVYADRAVGGRYINIDIDRKSAARYALNIQGIQEIVQTAIGGMNVTQTVEGRERYPVNMRYPQQDRDSVHKIKLLPIVTPTGAHIPLENVAHVYVADGPPVIKSENSRLTGWVLVDINGDVGSYIKDAKKAVAQNLKLPAGYTLSWSGQFEYMERANEQLMKVIPITLAIILLLLYLSFRKISDVLMIIGTLPLSIVGGVWLLYILGYNFSIAAGVGFIALAGVAVEIGVLMLLYMNQALANKQREVKVAKKTITHGDIQDAIIQGALLRIRPIMMTVVAIIAGLLPIMIGSGVGSEVMQRIAAPMIGGMVSATILTLLLLPAVFLVWKSLILVKRPIKELSET